MKCPYCKEEIADDAIKCKHCGSNLKKIDVKRYALFVFVIASISSIGLVAYTLMTPHFYEKRECHSKVIEQMKDPDSVEFFGEDEINDTPISQYGVQVYQVTISGKYRAKNGFGALNSGEFICNKIGTDGQITAQVGGNLDAYKKGLEIVTDGNSSSLDKIEKLNDLK